VTDSNPNYNGTDVVAKSGGNIVFVNINYRVGAFGYLASEKIRKNGDLNAGFWDQRKALEWVQKYIHLVGFSIRNCKRLRKSHVRRQKEAVAFFPIRTSWASRM
jgi:carboxylesterase type B